MEGPYLDTFKLQLLTGLEGSRSCFGHHEPLSPQSIDIISETEFNLLLPPDTLIPNVSFISNPLYQEGRVIPGRKFGSLRSYCCMFCKYWRMDGYISYLKLDALTWGIF